MIPGCNLHNIFPSQPDQEGRRVGWGSPAFCVKWLYIIYHFCIWPGVAVSRSCDVLYVLRPGLGGSFTSYSRFTLSDYTPSISGLWPTPPLPCHCHESDPNSGQGFLMSSQFNLVSCLLDLVHKFPKVRNGKTKVLRSLFVQHYLLFLFLSCTGWGEVYDSKSALTAWENINYYHGFPADFWWRGQSGVICTV